MAATTTAATTHVKLGETVDDGLDLRTISSFAQIE